MACDGLLTGDILFDCDNPMVGGIEVDVILINHADIDKSACTFNVANPTQLTNLQLKSGKTGFLLQGIKQINELKSELVKKELGPDKEKHIFAGQIINFSADNKKQLQAMKGGRFAVVVELKWKGTSSADAFQIGGFDSGLELNVQTWGTKTNDGQVSIELSSAPGYEESKTILSILETSYALTATAFSNKWAQA